MTRLSRLLSTLLTACAVGAWASTTTPPPAAKAASGSTAGTAKPGAAPAAGGTGGGVSSNGGNTAEQVKPKKPKCPDPGSTACPAVKVPVKTGG